MNSVDEWKVSSSLFVGGQYFVYVSDGKGCICRLDDEDEQTCKVRANLIAEAVNACAKINPVSPVSAAQSIKDLYEALKGIICLEGKLRPNAEFPAGLVKVPSNRLNAGIRALAKSESK